MAIRAGDQITIVDLTDAYSIMLSMDAITLNGGTTTLGTQQQVVVNVSAFRGSEALTPTVLNDSIVKPSNVTTSVGTASNNVVPITITFAAALNAGGRIQIPVSVDDIEVTKEFSFSISFKGTNGTSISISSIRYAKTTTSSQPADSSFTYTTIPSLSEGDYLWTKTEYSNGSKLYTVSKQGVSGTSVSVSGTSFRYAKSTSGTVIPTSGWGTTPVAPTTTEYAWTETTTTFSDGSTAVTYTVGGKTGTDGSNATNYQLVVSAAAINKNTNGVYNPASISVSAFSKTGTSNPAAYSGRFKIETTTANPITSSSTWTAQYTSSSNQSSYTYPATGTFPSGITAIRCSLYLAGGTTTLLAQEIVPIVSDGTNGEDGEDAITLVITSSGGTIFKNTSIATTLTAHVYKAGAELNASAIAALGTVKWYKDGGSTAVSTGTTLSISAGDVTNKAIYEARLETS